MPVSIKINDKGGFSFVDGKLQTIGSANTIDPLEVVQCLTVLFRTLPEQNAWHPDFGFDLIEATDTEMIEDVNLKPEDLIFAYVKSALADGEPRVDPEPTSFVAELDTNRHLKVEMSLRLVTNVEIPVEIIIGV